MSVSCTDGSMSDELTSIVCEAFSSVEATSLNPMYVDAIEVRMWWANKIAGKLPRGRAACFLHVRHWSLDFSSLTKFTKRQN